MQLCVFKKYAQRSAVSWNMNCLNDMVFVYYNVLPMGEAIEETSECGRHLLGWHWPHGGLGSVDVGAYYGGVSWIGRFGGWGASANIGCHRAAIRGDRGELGTSLSSYTHH